MTSSVPKLLTTEVVSSSLHEQIAQELAGHFLVHLRAEPAKPKAVSNNMSVFGRSGREVIDQ